MDRSKISQNSQALNIENSEIQEDKPQNLETLQQDVQTKLKAQTNNDQYIRIDDLPLNEPVTISFESQL